MKYVAYNYFPTPDLTNLGVIADLVFSSEIQLTHVSKNDPPKKWSGDRQQFLELLDKGPDVTNYIFAKDNKSKIEIDFTLGYHTENKRSTISISGINRLQVEKLCLHFANSLKSHACISGELGLGPKQEWSVLLLSDSCPKQLLEKIFNA